MYILFIYFEFNIKQLYETKARGRWEHIFAGRTQKIASLVAAYVTREFNKAFKNTLYGIYGEYGNSVGNERKYLDIMLSKIDEAYFDCRVFGVPNGVEVFNIFMWRSRDCVKNSKSMLAQAYCPHKELQGKNGEEQIQYCYEKTGQDWNVIEDRYKYGTIIKKELYLKPVDFRDLNYCDRVKYKTELHPLVTRSRFIQLHQNLSSFSREGVQLICSQYYK